MGRRGVIEIPADVREQAGWRGAYCRILPQGDQIVLQPIEDVHLRCLTLKMGPDTIHSASSTQRE